MKFAFARRIDRSYLFEAFIRADDNEWRSIHKWCAYVFGEPGDKWDHSNGGWFKLRGEEELTMFTLRWS